MTEAAETAVNEEDSTVPTKEIEPAATSIIIHEESPPASSNSYSASPKLKRGRRKRWHRTENLS